MQKVECHSTFTEVSFQRERLFSLRDAFMGGLQQGFHVVHSNQQVTVYLTCSTGNSGGEIELRCVSTSFSPVEYSVINWSALTTSIDDGNSRPYLKPVAGNYVGPAV